MAIVVRVFIVTLMTTELEHDLKANPTLLYALACNRERHVLFAHVATCARGRVRQSVSVLATLWAHNVTQQTCTRATC